MRQLEEEETPQTDDREEDDLDLPSRSLGRSVGMSHHPATCLSVVHDYPSRYLSIRTSCLPGHLLILLFSRVATSSSDSTS